MVQQEFIQVLLLVQLIIQTGEIILTSANITSISNVDGAASTRIRVFAIPNSNDIAACKKSSFIK